MRQRRRIQRSRRGQKRPRISTRSGTPPQQLRRVMLQRESSDVKHVRQRNRHACLRQRRRLQQWALRVRRHRRIQRRKIKTKWTRGRTRSGASTQKFKRMVLMRESDDAKLGKQRNSCRHLGRRRRMQRQVLQVQRHRRIQRERRGSKRLSTTLSITQPLQGITRMV